jgi:hypothetical protein
LSSDTRNVSFRRKPYPKYIKAVDVCRWKQCISKSTE